MILYATLGVANFDRSIRFYDGEVRAFHAVALTNGGSDNGAPAHRRHYTPTFYAAYVRDPDGNKLACVFHTYDPAALP